ncbi:helix-turn-helix transcriptional regulator [Lentzea sp. NPDC058450]|uniref:helix-turn-helix transcriptional regulator n=1 Tax=Lentzea sp. NPDC058450 TaxID=3346505 RepID=UPI0036551D90
MDDQNALGAFLRARREQVRPEQVGLTGGSRRRTPGLRREEVATLAGISSDYYLRLEQGRDRTPSPQILDALARVLLLDEAATGYLFGLVRPRPRQARDTSAQVPDGTLLLLRSLTLPAFVQDRYLDVLASNPLAVALSPNLRPGVNRLLAAFLDPAEQRLHADWDRATASAVGQLRAGLGHETEDPRAVALVGELSMRSDRFRQLWARQSVVAPAGGPATLHHPDVGELRLHREKYGIAGTDGQVLVIYHPEPGTPSAESLALLGSLAASADNAATVRSTISPWASARDTDGTPSPGWSP